MTIKIEIGFGEAFDRLIILSIKKSQILDYEKNKNISVEFAYMNTKLKSYIVSEEASELYNELYKINRTLWDVENLIREREKFQMFDSVFIEHARSVYKLNDERAAIKKQINNLFGSKFIEEKSYSSS
jgi:hypothetical protein